MVERTTSSLTIESALGLCEARDRRTIDAGAGAAEGLLVVADGLGGHCTGWLGARLAVRALVEPLASSDTEVRFVGAADEFPDNWGWAGAMQSRRAAELVYEECAADFGDRAAFPGDLAAAFAEIDRVVANVPNHDRITGLMVGCSAAIIEGARVRGAHVGIGRALLLRAGAHQFESLVVEHYLHLVANRTPEGRDIDPALLPPNIIVNALGGAATRSWVGVDQFEVELGAGDLLLLCSRRMDVPEEEVARIARAAVDEGAPLEELARTLERRSAAMGDGAETHYAKEVAFALALSRRLAG